MIRNLIHYKPYSALLIDLKETQRVWVSYTTCKYNFVCKKQHTFKYWFYFCVDVWRCGCDVEVWHFSATLAVYSAAWLCLAPGQRYWSFVSKQSRPRQCWLSTRPFFRLSSPCCLRTQHLDFSHYLMRNFKVCEPVPPTLLNPPSLERKPDDTACLWR